MQYVLWMFACLIGYGAGLFILWKVTPLIIVRAYDEGLFMAIMALDIFGGIFVFGAVAITFALFSGNIPIRTLDFLLLVGIVIMGASMSFRSFRPYRVNGTHFVSRMVAGAYCLALALAATFYLVLLFSPVNPT